MSYRTHRNLNLVLAILYIPISFFGFMMGMATEGTIGETNPLIIASCYTLAAAGMFTPSLPTADCCYRTDSSIRGTSVKVIFHGFWG